MNPFRCMGVAIGMMLVTGVAAQDLITFQPNTPARAEEVNANFRLLRDEISANTMAIMSIGSSPAPAGTRTVDCTGTDPDADYDSINDAIQDQPTEQLTLHISGICRENVVIHGLDGIYLLGDPFDGVADGITAVDGNRPALTVIGSQSIQLLDLAIEGPDRAVSITGASDVYIGFVTVTAATGHAIDIDGSQLTFGFDNSITGGSAAGSAALLARSSTVLVTGAGNLLAAAGGVPDTRAAIFTSNSAFESRRDYAPVFGGVLLIDGGASFLVSSASFEGPVLAFDGAHITLDGADATATSIMLNDNIMDIRGGATARFENIDIAPRRVQVDRNAFLLVRHSMLRTNTLGLSLGGALDVEISTIFGDVSAGPGGQFRQGIDAVVTGVISCASNAICL